MSPSHTPKGQDTYFRILHAAREAFAEKAYEKVSVSEIVRRASVAQGTFYHHFSSKADLLSALGRHLRQEMLKEGQIVLETSAKDANLENVFRTLINSALTISQKYEDVFTLVITQTSLMDQQEDRKTHAYPIMQKFLCHQQELGILRTDLDLVYILRLVDSVLTRLSQDLLFHGATVDKETYISQTVSFLVHALSHPINSLSET